MSAEGVAKETGMTVAQVRQALDRLLAVSYIRAVERDDQTLYRAARRSLR
jgi:hypothetical protein